MEPLDLARGLAAGRAALGAALVVAPDPILRVWIGRDGRRPGPQAVSVALGIRDLALGLGTLQALAADPSTARPWVQAGLVADAVDLLATLRARCALPRPGALLVAAMAATGAGLGAYVERALREHPQRDSNPRSPP